MGFSFRDEAGLATLTRDVVKSSAIKATHSIVPILFAGLAHLRFLTIHPFEDGNGRIARAIADLVLARAEGTEQRFYSLSGQIERERKSYSLELERAQGGDLEVTGWLDWFVGCLGRAIRSAEETLTAVLRKASIWEQANLYPVNDRQRFVLNRLLDGFPGASHDFEIRQAREMLRRHCAAGHPTALRLGHPRTESRRRTQHEPRAGGVTTAKLGGAADFRQGPKARPIPARGIALSLIHKWMLSRMIWKSTQDGRVRAKRFEG